MIKQIVKEINTSLDEIHKAGYVYDINFPIAKDGKICWSPHTCLSDYFAIENLYSLYKELLKNKEYTVLLTDGSIIQIYYEFNKDNLIKHRLFYFHFPISKTFVFDENEPLLQQLQLYEQVVTTDLDEEKVFLNVEILKGFGFIRFDYDKDSAENILHPFTHCTINQEKVRIPTLKPLTPREFLNFIFKNYYDLNLEVKKKTIFFEPSITTDEQQIFHIINPE